LHLPGSNIYRKVPAEWHRTTEKKLRSNTDDLYIMALNVPPVSGSRYA
jgi:hypothetical protein